MGTNLLLSDREISLPSAFFEVLIGDIPTSTWASLLRSNPTLREGLLEGFSARPEKLARFMRQPQAIARMRRFLNSNRKALEEILLLWGEEHLSVPSFLDMLDRDFLVENFGPLKDFLGPERFFAGLCILAAPGEKILDLVKYDPDFWKREEGPEAVEPLIPFWNLWRDFAARFPKALEWLEGASNGILSSPAETAPPQGREPDEQSQRGEEHQKKINKKLMRVRDDLARAQEEIARLRKENEEHRNKIAEWETSFHEKLDAAVARHRHERYLRYQALEEKPLEETGKRLESLLGRAKRAYELQRQADEQFGLVSSVRQQLLSVELHLQEIERIYADSLVVHSEVAKVKEAMILEKKRLHNLPGIEKVLGTEAFDPLSRILLTEIRLIEPRPESLYQTARFQRLITHLRKLDLVDEAQTLADELERKKRQMFEALYARFRPPEKEAASAHRFRDFDEFIRSGRSKEYDLFVDGYNILLRDPAERRKRAGFSLTALREEFISALQGKTCYFRRIYLVFDGIENSRERYGNLDVIFTDNPHGTTADTVIIQELKRRREQQALLVTSDEEIIRETQRQIHALVDPFDFQMFVFDVPFPEHFEA